MQGTMKSILFVLLVALRVVSAQADGPEAFPATFPPEVRELKLIEHEVKALAPGVTYYHFFFENIIPPAIGEFYDVSRLFLKAGTTNAVRTLNEIRDELKKGDKAAFEKVAKERFKYNSSQIPMFHDGMDAPEPPIKAAAMKLADGEISDVIETDQGCYLLRRNRTIRKFPVSVYYVVVDWDMANVSFKLAQSGLGLKTVANMVQGDTQTIAAVNGAYFHYIPPKPYYPLKIDGKIFEPKSSYDSKIGMMFNYGKFPVLDTLDNLDKYDNAILGYHVWKDGASTLAKPGSHWHMLLTGNAPLSAVGFNKERRRIVLMTSDGRFPNIVSGLNLYSACYFLSLMGCTDCLTIDGGGSCQMLIRDSGKLDLKNRPSDNGLFEHNGARPVQSCVYLVTR